MNDILRIYERFYRKRLRKKKDVAFWEDFTGNLWYAQAKPMYIRKESFEIFDFTEKSMI